MNYWLVKSDPGTYGWTELLRDGKASWDGVRNPVARNNLKAMKEGDLVLFYHTGEEKAIVGISKVVGESYPDPTTKDARWLAVDLAPVKPVKNPVTLAQVKADKSLKHIALVRQSRLSVMPLDKAAYDKILSLG
jgi:predicted RNA-binding protein with PUA-like domain